MDTGFHGRETPWTVSWSTASKGECPVMVSQLQPKNEDVTLNESLRVMSEACVSCGLCMETCQFLKVYGTPGSIAGSYADSGSENPVMPFECNLCGLCSSICPKGMNPRDLFLEMRRDAVLRGKGTFPEHAGLLNYEKRGTSRRFTWYGLPRSCDTIFFPGCALPGTRPQQTKTTFRLLREIEPNLGVVLDCCTKPSHDLGRQEYFLAMFGEMKDYLVAQGVRRVIVACPNCYKVFREYAPELATLSVYEVLSEDEGVSLPRFAGNVTVHDPCSIRHETRVQDAVRMLSHQCGLCVAELSRNRSEAFCCGEGGGVSALAPHFSSAWADACAGEASGSLLVTSCAGCANFLGSRATAIHILDLLHDPQSAMAGKPPVSRAPLTYLNRLRLKKYLRKSLPVATSREREFSAGEKSSGISGPFVVAILLVAAIVAIHVTGLGRYLEQDQLRSLIAGYGVLAPAVYLLIYTLAPALLLPALPITLAGGVLFGPLWGVVYTITGSTAGACVAFLVSRYLARDWVEARLAGSRWKKLDSEVEKHGWKVVAFTRLIPLFPFNLLNYAFGLTKIRFIEYAVATFFCMLPACIAFIVFSSSLLDLLHGRISARLLLGIALIVLVSLLPVVCRRVSLGRKTSERKAGTER